MFVILTQEPQVAVSEDPSGLSPDAVPLPFLATPLRENHNP